MTDKTLTPPAPVSRPPDALSFNDDDLYLVNTVTRQCLRRVGVRADNVHELALMTGLQAKHFCKGA